MQEVRNAVAALRPTSVATLNLTEALTQLGAEFERVTPETELTLDLDTSLPSLSPELQLALYRAAQEALTNVRKHAHATKVLLNVSGSKLHFCMPLGLKQLQCSLPTLHRDATAPIRAVRAATCQEGPELWW